MLTSRNKIDDVKKLQVNMEITKLQLKKIDKI